MLHEKMAPSDSEEMPSCSEDAPAQQQLCGEREFKELHTLLNSDAFQKCIFILDTLVWEYLVQPFDQGGPCNFAIESGEALDFESEQADMLDRYDELCGILAQGYPECREESIWLAVRTFFLEGDLHAAKQILEAEIAECGERTHFEMC
eukprot:gnl/MRDRNA2_/MRDRNA2_155265_c0_seq1.p1 gnl/MRDRNA2_/MRDRNA2_155265_c0~~gnl/MRDRNA2_/MRDRNA2_155265_c0_seq1.p1  ORF type:complete len:149 (-),score=32.28 gnl/MRDRNA2_/MRDRNA2_155265_c0_seq1:63-509(-)